MVGSERGDLPCEEFEFIRACVSLEANGPVWRGRHSTVFEGFRRPAGILAPSQVLPPREPTRAVIRGLTSGRIGALGLDVYEEEADLFFEDLSNQVIQDDVFARLLTFPNVLITGHQAFFTEEALTAIAETTIANLSAFEQGGAALHEVAAE